MDAAPTTFVAVPTRGQVDVQVADAVSKLATQLGTTPFYERGHLSAGMTRNRIVNVFLTTGMDVLLMVDDDVVPTGTAHLLPDRLTEGFDVVGAAYPIFKPDLGIPLPFPPAWTENHGVYELVNPTNSGVTECDAIGTGCVAIRRQVLELLETPFAEVMGADGQIVSDDSVFCKRARLAGFRIGMDFGVRCDHLCRVSLGAILAGVTASREHLLAQV